jgi:hypothetical protein
MVIHKTNERHLRGQLLIQACDHATQGGRDAIGA